MKSKVLTRLTRLTLFASIAALVNIAPAVLADVPFQPQLLAATPISQSGLKAWMPPSISKRFEGSKLYMTKTKFDGGMTVGFAYTNSCGGTSCSAGSMTIRTEDLGSEGQPVQLTNGITGYMNRGAGMNGITWQQNNLNYELNFKLSPDDLVTYANFVIKQMEKQQG